MAIPEHLINTVYLGDVFDLMRQLPDKSVDMVFSDPDYNVGVRYNGKSYTRSLRSISSGTSSWRGNRCAC
jgi:DNA modification methylase